MRITGNQTLGLFVDFQEKLLPHITHHEEILENTLKLIAGLKVLNIPLLITSSSSSSYSNSSVDRTAAWQANRDWNAAIRAKSYIGTAYSSSCRPGNPYC